MRTLYCWAPRQTGFPVRWRMGAKPLLRRNWPMSSRTRLSGSQPGRKGRGWSSSRTSASLGSSSANQRRAESGQRGARGSGTRGWRRKAKRLRISTFLGWPPFCPAAVASLAAADPLLATALNTFLSVASQQPSPVCSTGRTVYSLHKSS